jgi:hypothetical protein
VVRIGCVSIAKPVGVFAESARRLQPLACIIGHSTGDAGVAELADAQDLGCVETPLLFNVFSDLR